MSDVGGNDLGFRLLGQPSFDLGSGGTRLLDGSAIRHLHFDQHLRSIGSRKELLLHHAHAQYRDDERADDAPRDQPFAANHKTEKLAEAVVARRVVDRLVPALTLRDVREQLHSQVGREHDGNDPGCDQRDADDPEHVAGVLAGSRLGEAVRHEADRGHQGPGEHGRGGMAPCIGRRADAVVAFLHLHDHHLDGDDRVVDQQPQRQYQRPERDPVEVLAGGRHDDEHRGQRQRNRRRDDDADAPSHAEKAHEHHHAEGGEELDHELVDGRPNIDGLVRDFGQAHAERHFRVDRRRFRLQRLAEVEAVPALAHDHAEQQGRLAVVADQEGRRILVAALHFGDVGELQGAALRGDGGIADRLQIVDRAVQPDEDLRALGFDRAAGRHDVAAVERGEDVPRRHAQGGEAVIGELDEDPFRLLADDVHLLDARHVQQSLAQDLRIANQVSMRLALRLQCIERKGHVGIFVVHDRTDHATRQVVGLVAEFLPRLIELLGDLGRRSAVAQDHRGEGQARPREGLGPVVPAELLHPLLQLFGDQLFHLLCRGPRPSRDDGHLLDRERGVFRAAQRQEGHDAGDGNRHEQEQRDGALAYGEGGEIEAAHGRPAH